LWGGLQSLEFEVDVEKDENGLGIDVASLEVGKLLISRIKVGPLLMWNKHHPEQGIYAGDRIKQVNGEEGTAEELIKLIKSLRSLRLTIVRLYEFKVSVVRDGKLGMDVAQYANSLRILNVGAGPFQAWNSRCACDVDVRAGDHLIEVNGIRGTCIELLDAIQAIAQGTLEVLFIRGHPRDASRKHRLARVHAIAAEAAQQITEASLGPIIWPDSQDQAASEGPPPPDRFFGDAVPPARMAPEAKQAKQAALRPVAPWPSLVAEAVPVAPAAGSPMLPSIPKRTLTLPALNRDMYSPTAYHPGGRAASESPGGWRSPLALFGLGSTKAFFGGEEAEESQPKPDVIADMV